MTGADGAMAAIGVACGHLAVSLRSPRALLMYDLLTGLPRSGPPLLLAGLPRSGCLPLKVLCCPLGVSQSPSLIIVLPHLPTKRPQRRKTDAGMYPLQTSLM